MQTAQRLQHRLRRNDILARLGGDEFLVAVLGLSPDTAAQEAAALAAELSQALTQPIRIDGHPVQVKVSVGTSTYPHDGDSFASLLHTADTRMYECKHPASTRSRDAT